MPEAKQMENWHIYDYKQRAWLWYPRKGWIALPPQLINVTITWLWHLSLCSCKLPLTGLHILPRLFTLSLIATMLMAPFTTHLISRSKRWKIIFKINLLAQPEWNRIGPIGSIPTRLIRTHAGVWVTSTFLWASRLFSLVRILDFINKIQYSND